MNSLFKKREISFDWVSVCVCVCLAGSLPPDNATKWLPACLVLIPPPSPPPPTPTPPISSSAFNSVVFVIDALSNDFHAHHTQIFVRTQCGPISLDAPSGTATRSPLVLESLAKLPGAWFCRATRLPAAGVRLINPN